MTTSYKLSLRLKELGVEQIKGEYYWVNEKRTNKLICHYHAISDIFNEQYNANYIVLCRAFTLGELVRELPELSCIDKAIDGYRAYTYDGNMIEPNKDNPTPEEAAGELLAEILSQEKQKEG